MVEAERGWWISLENCGEKKTTPVIGAEYQDDLLSVRGLHPNTRQIGVVRVG